VTRRLAKGTRLVVASHNHGKLHEIQELIAPFGVEPVSASKLGLVEPVETGTMFASNARLKSRAAAKASSLPALGDDSGLCVDALDGAPGIFSARWAGPNKDFASAMARVECELKKRSADCSRLRRAHFVSALCLSWPDGEDAIFEGRVFGTLVWPPRGGHGFGYDPMFLADGETLTFGEMTSDRKHAISHRARAFKLFIGASLSAT
jgi:XTP/dITP diphosphohydrolase